MRRLAWENAASSAPANSSMSPPHVSKRDRQERHPDPGLAEFCLRNIHTVALLIARCALAREESRGAHFRTDYPEKQPAFQKHSVDLEGP